MTAKEQIKAVQRKLGKVADGIAGPITWQAIYDVIVGKPQDDPVDDGEKVDARSEGNIKTLLPQVQPFARMLVKRAAKAGVTIKVLSGFRSYAEQQKLYDAYKAGGPKAASPGNSAHNFGIGFDIGVFKGSAYLGESPSYKVVGTIGRAIGLHWGADFGDEPHFAKRPPSLEGHSEAGMMKELRRRKAAGEALWP